MKKHRPKYDVLIADDHKIFRVGLSTMLRNISCIGRVHEAVNGKEALAIIKEHRCDFVFMDIKMPVMDGVTATKAIVASHPETRVIAISVYDDDKYLQEMLAGGAKGYLLKNTDQDEIEDAMRTVINGKPYYSKTVSDKLLKQVLHKRSTKALLELTLREKEVLYCLWLELSSKEIAEKLFISAKTVEVYRSRLIEKTNSKNTISLVKYAIQHGIVAEMERIRGKR